MEFLNPRSEDEDDSNENGNLETTRLESCIGVGCNEKQFVVGSVGIGSVGLFTYCADCYPNVSKNTDIGGESDVVFVPSVDLSRTDTKNKKQTTRYCKMIMVLRSMMVLCSAGSVQCWFCAVLVLCCDVLCCAGAAGSVLCWCCVVLFCAVLSWRC